jgi:hypothetical protein
VIIDLIMKKYLYFSAIFFFLNNISVSALSIDHSYVLGFDGIYKENSWTPLIIRISNDDKSISGNLIIETDNSSTTFEQKRRYIKPVDLPSGSHKELSFVIPIGHHSRDIRYFFESDNSIIFENIIRLKQMGINNNFILGVSPYPDLGFLNNHPGFKSRTISYPHIDNLPQNSNAYDGVEIISIHREMMDKLSGSQFRAISGWVSNGGKLVVWGGKSPSPSRWNYLPSEIKGLKKIDSYKALSIIDNSPVSEDSILINQVKTPDRNRLITYENMDLISLRKTGNGSIYFISFDYSGALKSWPGLNRIWDIIFESQKPSDPFSVNMSADFLLENYIDFFDNSGFTYLDRMNVALILFLSASASVSMLIFIRFRRKSSHLYIYITGLMIFLSLLSIFIFLSLNNNNFRTDCFVISSNIVYQQGESEKSLLFKDILIGSSNKTSSDIILHNDSLSILKQNKIENLSIEETPEKIFKNTDLDQWSSRIFRLRRSIDSILTIHTDMSENVYSVNIQNRSDYFIHDSFIYLKGYYYKIENILPGNSVSLTISDNSDINKYSNSFPLAETAADLYLKQLDIEGKIFVGGFISDDIFPLEFTNKSWKKKTVNLILSSDRIDGGNINE